MRFRNVTLGMIVGLLALVLLMGFVKYRQIAGAGGGWGEVPQSVTTAEATTALWQPMISTTGTIVARQSVELKNEVAGRVKTISLEAGQVVDGGTLLVELDAGVEQAELRAAQARLKLTQLSESRVVKSAASNAVTPMEVDTAHAATEAAAADVQRYEALIAQKTIKAPFKAVVGLSDVHVGQYLVEGTTITSLQGVDEQLYVDFAMPQEMAQRMPIGAPVRILAGDKEFNAVIQSTDALVNQMTRSLRTRVAIQKKDAGGLEPGMSVSVKLHAAVPRSVVTVPAVSIRRSAWGDSVFVVAMDEKNAPRAKRISVSVGSSLGERVIIDSGIVAGQLVVADGSFKLQENNLLNVMPATSQPTTRAGAQ